MNQNLNFTDCSGKADLAVIKQFQEKNKVTLPSAYVQLVTRCDAARLEKTDLVFYDDNRKRYVQVGIDVFLSWSSDYKYSKLIDYYHAPPEFFPKGLLAFGLDGGGNLFCFDYRENPLECDPQIVFWNHELDSVNIIAKNFNSFIASLMSFEEAFEAFGRHES
ncbi:MAG: SMI1/KNR4 family protein [Alphaproteobacteria bacterium]|nr:MAG: SMI1/KNR4 family protein [Alphaproteobacteria bacterium]